MNDSRLAFAAIRLACPGGLGRVSQEDVCDEPTLPLRAIMALAADRDLIARQYADGYREVLHSGVPWLKEYLSGGLGLEEAIMLTHLRFLAEYPDSLIARKYGLEKAREVSARAGTVLAAHSPNWRAERREPPDCAIRPLTPLGSPELAKFDSWLVAGRLNPGTSADLVTACLFVALREGIIRSGEWGVASGE